MYRTKRLRDHLHLHHHHHHHKHSAGSREDTPLLNVSSTSTSRSNQEVARPSHIRFNSSSNPIPPSEIPNNRIPLLLDPEQVTMIHNLNTLHLERVLTFWPWCWNTHAMLVVRYVYSSGSSYSGFSRRKLIERAAKRFKYQEEGRAVVRNWAEWILEVGNEVASSANQ